MRGARARGCPHTRVLARLAVQAPFPWAAMLDYLSRRLIPPCERIDDGAYCRTLERGEVRVSFDALAERLVVRASGDVDPAAARKAVARLFDVAFDPAPAIRHLRRTPLLAHAIACAPGLRPLGAWSAFELCMRTVIGQQVSVAGANTLTARLAQRCGPITPQSVLGADLAKLGMPGKRVETLRALAGAVVAGRLPLEEADWAEVDAALSVIPGIGPWTRAYLAIRLGRVADAMPHSDLGLIRATGAANPSELLRLAEAWRPWRGHAAIYLWSAPPERLVH